MHVGRAQRHERWFRAPARCRSETGAPFRAPAGMGRGGEFTLVGRSVMRAGFALPRDAGRRPALRRAPAGMGCGGECTLAGRSVIGAGFALPRDAGRRPALLSRASRDGMWWGIHVGRAPRHEGWFRAPARCRSETGAPFARQSGWDVVRNSRWQGAASSARVSRSRAMPTGGRRSLACAPLCPVGARRNCIFTARGGVALTGAGRRVISAGFALPRVPTGGRRSLACAPLRPVGYGATAFSRQEVVWHSRGQGAVSSARVSRSRAMPVWRPALLRSPLILARERQFSHGRSVARLR